MHRSLCIHVTCDVRHTQSILDALQFFARGLFASPIITHFRGPGKGLMDQLRMCGWAARALTLSALDWPLRRVTTGSSTCLRGRFITQVARVEEVLADCGTTGAPQLMSAYDLAMDEDLGLLAGTWNSRTVAVPSAPRSYDRELASALWDLTADKCGLDR